MGCLYNRLSLADAASGRFVGQLDDQYRNRPSFLRLIEPVCRKRPPRQDKELHAHDMLR